MTITLLALVAAAAPATLAFPLPAMPAPARPLHGGAFPPPPPSGPSTGGPAPPPGPAAAGAPTTPGSGARDPLDWSHWWHLERDAFLGAGRARFATAAAPPGGTSATLTWDINDDVVEAKVAPIFIRAVAEERQDDVRTAALIALGRIGTRLSLSASDGARAAMRAAARDASAEVSETALLSLGLFGDVRDVAPLVDVLCAREEAKVLLGSGAVEVRKRAFAGFALGLLADECTHAATAQVIAAAAMEVARDASAPDDARVAAAIALGLVRLPGTMTPPPPNQREAEFAQHVVSSAAAARWALALVTGSDPLPPAVRCHAFVAAGRLAARAGGQVRARAIAALADASSARGLGIQERSSAIIGLGELLDGRGDSSDDAGFEALTEALRSGQPMERKLAGMALATASTRTPQAGGTPERAKSVGIELGRSLARVRSGDRAWAALALAVHAHRARRAGVPVDGAASAKIRGMIRKERDVGRASGLVVAAALAGMGGARAETTALSVELRALHRTTKAPARRARLALALGLVGDAKSKKALERDLEAAKYRPEVLWSTSVALHLLGSDDLVPKLLDLLERAPAMSVRASLSAAVGRVGDARAVEPLVELAAREDVPAGVRAFAIVGLGVLVEDRRLPWRFPIAHALPYFAPTMTLWGDGKGLLELL